MKGRIRVIKLLLARSGSYDRSKFKVLSLLDQVWQHSQRQGGEDYLTIKRIAIFSGIPYYSLSHLLKRYTYQGLIESRSCGEVGAPCSEGYSEYTILAKGQRWLRKAETDLRSAGQFSKELSEHIAKVRPVAGDILKLPFKDFIHQLKDIDANKE